MSDSEEGDESKLAIKHPAATDRSKPLLASNIGSQNTNSDEHITTSGGMRPALKLDKVTTARQHDDSAPYSDNRQAVSLVTDPDIAIKTKVKEIELARGSELISFEAQLQNQIVNEYRNADLNLVTSLPI